MTWLLAMLYCCALLLAPTADSQVPSLSFNLAAETLSDFAEPADAADAEPEQDSAPLLRVAACAGRVCHGRPQPGFAAFLARCIPKRSQAPPHLTLS